MQSASPNIIDYASPGCFPVSMPPLRQILIGLALFTVPEMFYRLYQPFNETWLVRKFGCGCPDVRTGRVPFPNANDISLVLYSLLALILCALFFLIFRRSLKHWPFWPSASFFGTAFSIILILCFYTCASGAWL